MLRNWGGAHLLDSYESERKPVAIRNSLISAMNSDKIDMVMAETPPDIGAPTTAAAESRSILARKIKWLARQFNSAGTHLGYRYVDSPIVVPDATPEPPDDPAQLTPSSWPGMRAPHAWLRDGRSTLDLFGTDFVMVRFANDVHAEERLRVAADRQKLPLQIVGLDEPAIASLYEKRWVLVRPDGHVAWRGDELPAELDAMVARVRGATPP